MYYIRVQPCSGTLLQAVLHLNIFPICLSECEGIKCVDNGDQLGMGMDLRAVQPPISAAIQIFMVLV